MFVLLLAVGCQARRPPASIRWPAMSTLATVSVPASHAAALPGLRDDVSAAFAEVEGSLSVFREDSDLAAVNRNAGGNALPVNAHVAAVLDSALRVARASGGAFDPTIGPLMRAWGFRDTVVTSPPSPDVLSAALADVGWQHVETLTGVGGTNRVRLARAGMRLDLGAIAKGYAVDLACARLRPAHDSFLVDLGGNLRAYGEAAPGRGGWRTGIRNPFDRSMLIGTVLMTNGEAVATSGNYERFINFENRRYAHIMDPRTGWPVQGMAGITVLAPSAMEADALSTTLFVLGPADGARLLQMHPGCEALWVPDEQPPWVLATPGFRARLEPADGWRDRLRTVP
jgi:thiamine biosynthesis lipoprotein